MALTNLAILATQNKRPSPESITSDVAHIHLLPNFPGRVSRVKSYLWMVTVVRMVNPFYINNLPVAIGRMSMATVVSPFRINSLQAIGRIRAIILDAKLARLPMLPGWTRQSGATYMRNAPRIGSLMGAIYASRQNCWPGGISNGDGISHTASGPRLRYVRDAVSSFYRTRPST